MDILELSVLKGFIRMCQDGWDQGWHERNGGNLTYRLTEEEANACRPYFESPREWVRLEVPAANLAGEYYLTLSVTDSDGNVSNEYPMKIIEEE